MPSSRIPSPARSQGAKHTPRRYKPRFSRSVGSPARSDTSVKLSAVLRMDSFVLSPMPTRRSVLTDTTDIDIPRRKSWWKKLDENSREIMEVINNKEPIQANNAIEEYIDVDVLSQEKKNYTLDLPESSDGESINSIVIPQRKLFTQKQSQGQNKFGQIMDKRETVAKLQETQAVDEKDLNVGPKNLFNQGKKQRSKPIFPTALLNISANKTLANKTKELPPNEAKGQVKSLFGNRPGTKRKNMFADFIVSESEDEISEIQPKVFRFQKKLTQKSSNLRDGREQSPTSSITDVEMDDWRLLPSSTMVDHQLEDGLRTTPSKRARLSKLSEAVESVNATANKTKQSNKTMNSKSRSKNASKFNEMEEHEFISPTNDDELDAVAHDHNHSINKSLSRNSKNVSHEKSLKKQTSKIKEHSKSKNSAHMKTLNEDVESEAIVNNEENKNNNKSKQNKTSNTLTKIDQALQASDDDEDFTLEYENDDEGVEDIESNKTTNDNAPQISHQHLKNSKNSNISKNNVSQQVQNKTKNQSIIQQENPQINSDEGLTMQEKEIGPHEKRKSSTPEVDQYKNNQNSNDNQYVQIQQRETSYNKSQRNEKNISKNASHTRKLQEDDVEFHEIELEEILDEAEPRNNEAIDDEQNNSESNEVDEEQNQEDDDNNQENNDEILEKDQATSREVEDDGQNDPQSDEDEAEQTDEVQNSQKVDNTNEGEEMVDDDKSDSQEEINEEIEGENEETEDENEDMRDQDEEMEEENEGMEDENEEGIVEDNQDEAANVTAVDNNDQSQEHSVNNEDIQEATDNNEGEEDGDVSNDIQNNDESQNNIDDGEEEEMQESDQNVSQEVESEEDEVPERQDASETEEEQEVEDSDQNVSQIEENVSQNSQENVSESDQENAETEDQEDEVSHKDSREEEVQQSDDQDESEEEIDNDNVNEIEDEVDNNDESAGDERNTADIEEVDQTHDTTGRHRNKQEQRVSSPEAILHDKTNAMESFTVQGRNTSVRKTKSIIRKNRSPSLAPVRESTGLSDGVRDSSGEGSGWDSHRTTRLTIRQTIGRDFTPRKSLRALVMEKSAKRHTNYADTNADIKEPRANSTELPRQESFDMDHDDGFDEVPSDHEESRRMRQTTLEMYLQKVKEKNIERKKQLEDEIRSSLKAPTRDMLNPFKVPAIPKRTVNRVKQQSKAKAKIKSVIPLNLLPAEVLEDMKYKPPKRYQPANASWITKRLYKFLETKLEPKYDYKARVRSEKLVETLYNFTKDIRRLAVAPPPAVDALKQEMARLNVVATHVEFYEFFHEYMPREVRVKVVPDVFNKISLPKHGVFSDILR